MKIRTYLGVEQIDYYESLDDLIEMFAGMRKKAEGHIEVICEASDEPEGQCILSFYGEREETPEEEMKRLARIQESQQNLEVAEKNKLFELAAKHGYSLSFLREGEDNPCQVK